MVFARGVCLRESDNRFKLLTSGELTQLWRMSRDIVTCCKLDIKREAFISDYYYKQKSNKPFDNNVSNKFYRNPIEKQRI